MTGKQTTSNSFSLQDQARFFQYFGPMETVDTAEVKSNSWQRQVPFWVSVSP